MIAGDDATGRIVDDLWRCRIDGADHLYRHLTRGIPLNSDGKSALETLRIITDIENDCEGEDCE